MIDFILGKPGAGKGVMAMHRMIEEIVHGDRNIITDLAVRLHPWVRKVRSGMAVRFVPQMGLLCYLQSKYGKTFNAESRVHVLDEAESARFYLWRVVEGKLTQLKYTTDRNGNVETFETQAALDAGGVLYVTDEAWSILGARNWQNTGKGVLFYAAQHRKLGDDWLVVTQHSKQIDTAVRQVAQSYWVVRNHSKLRLGFFKHPDVFTVAIYEQPPDKSSMPMERRTFRLDKAGVGSCFDTAAGKGVKGGVAADIGHKTKGLPWWTVLVALAAIGIGWYGFTQWVAKKNHERMLAGSKIAQKQIEGKETHGKIHEEAGSTNVATWQQNTNAQSVVSCQGVLFLNGRPKIILSTGEIYEPTNYFRNGQIAVEVDGHTYPVAKAEPGEQGIREVSTHSWGGNVVERYQPKVEVTVIGRRPETQAQQPAMRYQLTQ